MNAEDESRIAVELERPKVARRAEIKSCDPTTTEVESNKLLPLDQSRRDRTLAEQHSKITIK